MLNDVHAPPLEPRDDKPPTTPPRSDGGRKLDRAHELDARSEHRSAGTNLIYAEPEDRGDSFNTTMSAVIVGVVLLTIAGIAWAMWR